MTRCELRMVCSKCGKTFTYLKLEDYKPTWQILGLLAFGSSIYLHGSTWWNWGGVVGYGIGLIWGSFAYYAQARDTVDTFCCPSCNSSEVFDIGTPKGRQVLTGRS